MVRISNISGPSDNVDDAAAGTAYVSHENSLVFFICFPKEMLISAAVDGCRGSPTFVYYLRFTKFPVDQLLAELKYTIMEFDLFCYTAAHNNIKVGR